MALILHAIAPYDFRLSTWIFSSGDPQIRKSENERFWQVIRTGGKLVLAEISSIGTTSQPAIKVRLSPERPLSPDDVEQSGNMISKILNINDFLAPFYEAARDDPPLYGVVKKLIGLKAPSTPTVFEAVVDSIIEQQISLPVARTLESRLTKKFGDSLTVKEKVYYAFPRPQGIASGKPEEFRSCGLSAMKGEYIRNIGHQVASGDLDLEDMRNRKDSEEIIGELTKLRGVGRWTAELAVLRGMHRFDVVPADDLGLRRAIAKRYCRSTTISSEEVRKMAERWGWWKGLAAYYLLVAEMKGI
jgi:DNA-3-methyladenine glycosylase II